MKMERVDISSLKPDPANARKHGKRNLEAIKGEELANKIVLMLVRGIPAEVIQRSLVNSGQKAATIKKLIQEAKKKITLAADYNREEEIGVAYLRLNELYKRAMDEENVRAALDAQRELNKLMDLYRSPLDELKRADDGDEAEHAKELEMIRRHLLPLKLAPESYPLHEHARIAAGLISGMQHKPDARNT